MIPKNCNHCEYKQALSQHYDLSDICSLNKLNIGTFNMKEKCLIEELESEGLYGTKRQSCDYQ